MEPKKSLSQNFLIDKNICKKIISHTSIKNKNIMEIGPGYGNLTEFIINEKPKNLYLVEKDDYLSEYLSKKYKKHSNIYVYNKDLLNFNLNEFRKLIVISNLPYNLSTKIILHLFNYYKIIDEILVMIQKEVAYKFDYSLPKMNKYKFYTKNMSIYKRCFNVSPQVFFPKPKINSTVVKFKINKKDKDISKLELFCKIIFKKMRKKIINKLEIETKDSVILHKRVDQLNINELLRLYNFF